MNIVVVYNSKSGSALKPNELRQKFEKANIVVDEMIDITDQLETKLKPWVKKAATIAVIGGDGTINSLAGKLAGTKSVLAPLPGGTLNHFTKDLGIDQDIDSAIAALKTASIRTVDIAHINGRIFVNNSSIGIYPSSLVTRKRFEAHLGKWPAAVVGSLRAFIRYRLHEVTIDGKTFKTPFIFIGNNDYKLDKAGERTRMNAGVLSVYAITSGQRRDTFKLLGAAIMGKLAEEPVFDSYITQSITIHTKRSKISVSVDGELIRMNTPLKYEIGKGELRVIGSS
jgi:diacylglycerol kinase family enzyme